MTCAAHPRNLRGLHRMQRIVLTDLRLRLSYLFGLRC